MLNSRSIETGCTVRVINTFDSLEAHVELDDGLVVQPGDEVKVHGAPIRVPYGETLEIRRRATVRRAGPHERARPRPTGALEHTDHCENSLSAEKQL